MTTTESNRNSGAGGIFPTQGVSRRTFIGVVGALGGAGALAACTTSGTGKTKAGSSTINMWTYLTPEDPRGKSEREIFNAAASRNGLTINYNVVPWNQLDTNLIAALRGGNQPDVSRCLHSYLGQQFNVGTLRPLDDYIKTTFSSEQMSDFALQYNDDQQTRAMLVDNQQTGLLIRADWLDSINRTAPKTWEEFVDLAQELQGARKGVVGYGAYASSSQLNHDQFLFQSQIHGRGGRLLNDEGRAVYNDDIGVEVFQFYRDLVHKHRVVAPSLLNDTYENSFEAFSAGRTAMSLQPSNRYNAIAKKLGADKVMVVPIPGPTAAEYSPAPSMGWSLVIPKDAKNPDAAWKVIADRLKPENQEKFSKDTLNLPTSKSAMDLPFYKTPEAAAIRTWFDLQSKYGERLILPADGNAFNLALANALQTVILKPNEAIKPILDRAVKTYNALL